MTDPPASNQPRSRGVIALSFHKAAIDLFGPEGLRSLGAALSEEVRRATVDEEPLALAWYPTAYLLEWWDAVLAGPARGDEAKFAAFVDKCNELGFGRIRKALLSFVGPEGLVSRAAELWRHDHTHGTLTMLETRASGVKALLRDHPFMTSPLGRKAITEALRYILSLARGVRRVSASHQMVDGGLVMLFAWGAG